MQKQKMPNKHEMQKKMDIQDWLNWMMLNHQYNLKLGIEKLIPFAKSLDVIDFNCPVIVVAGTNGKGSTIKLMESILLSAGFNVGVYTSPHLIEYNERIRINGKNISTKECILGFTKVKKVLDQKHCLDDDYKLTYFEFATLSALVTLKSNDDYIDIIILEIGLGGRLDAVNVVNNDIAIITTIDFDHTEILGNTREQIAREKSGIFKANAIAICGDFNPPDIVFDIASKLNVSLKCINKDYSYQFQAHRIDVNNQIWNYYSKTSKYLGLPKINLPMQNAATALRAIDELQKVIELKYKYLLPKYNNFSLEQNKQKIIIHGLNSAVLNGRFQIENYKDIEIILDVAHNPHAAIYLAEQFVKHLQLSLLNDKDGKSVSKNANQTCAIFAIQKNKDWKKVVEPFINIVKKWYLIEVDTVCSLVSSKDSIDRNKDKNNREKKLKYLKTPNYPKAKLFRANELAILMKNSFKAQNIDVEVSCDVLKLLNKLSKEQIYKTVLTFGSFKTVAKVLKTIDVN